jgi:hypothetical protein
MSPAVRSTGGDDRRLNYRRPQDCRKIAHQKILPLRYKPRILKDRGFLSFFRSLVGVFIAQERNKRR